jgi:hypothetical protein
MLFDDASIPEYYSPALMPWQFVLNNVYFAYTDPATGKRITQPPLPSQAFRLEITYR